MTGLLSLEELLKGEKEEKRERGREGKMKESEIGGVVGSMAGPLTMKSTKVQTRGALHMCGSAN